MKKLLLILLLLISSQSHAADWDNVFVVYKWEVQGITYFTNDVKRIPAAYIRTVEIHLVDGIKKLTLISRNEEKEKACPNQ